MERSEDARSRRARGLKPVAVAAVILGVVLSVGVSQAGAGAPAQVPAQLPLGEPLAGPEQPCTRALERIGVCKRPHDHDAQADFEPYDGDQGEARTARGHEHPHSHLYPDARSHAGGRVHASGRTRGKTTQERTIQGAGDPADGFQALLIGAGEGRIVREELAKARPGRAKRRRSLLYVGQTTDWQLVDEESPARVEFLDIAANPPFPSTVSAAWRPQEALGPQSVEQSIRQLNQFADASPVRHRGGRRAAMDMVLMTGDQADNQQLNETEWVRTLLEGGLLDPNSGTDPSTCPAGLQPSGQTADPKLYAGVQDYDDYLEGQQFYDPDQPAGPKYSDWPTYPGLMDRAQLPFLAQGLKAPSYVVFGNHDGLAQGNEKALLPFELVGVGCLKPLVPVTDLTEIAGVLDPAYLLGLLATDPEQVMLVPPDERRQYVDKIQYKDIFLDSTQPDGHGFSFIDEQELEASDGAASYYAWTPKPRLRLIGLDTLCEGGVAGPSASGNIDDPQWLWLERQLERASVRDQLVVVFGHHPIRSLDCSVPDETPPPCTVEGQFGHDINAGCDRDPRDSQPLHFGDDLTELFHRHPHVIAYIAGHTHENLVGGFDRPQGGPGDFWGIETASLIDWPPQNRLIELMDNCDGTLSIFGTTIDSAAPATAPASGTPAQGLTGADLGSISRTLAFNDPQAGFGTGEGERSDRNVELLVADPRRDPPPCRRAADGEPPTPEPPDREPVQPETDEVPTAGAGAGGLPFTGFLLLGLLVAGAGLAGVGGLLRWISRARR